MAGSLRTHREPHSSSSECAGKNDKNGSLTVQSESMFEYTFHIFISSNMLASSALLFVARENAFFENS